MLVTGGSGSWNHTSGFSDLDFQLRIIRSGSTLTFRYTRGGSSTWSTVSTKSWVSDDITVKLLCKEMSVNFDNFKINSGTIKWPKGAHPNRKKFQIRTVDDFICPVEIESWDFYTKQVKLHTKVPSISSSEDTLLKLIYDSSIDNNILISDTVTTSGVADLIRYYQTLSEGPCYLASDYYGTGLEFKLVSDLEEILSIKSTFLDLDDTPTTYSGGQYLRTTTSGIQAIDGIILKAPNDSEWLIQVTNSGTLYTVEV